MRWVFYVDLDAYYVSCARRDRPGLEGRPVIVGPDPSVGPSRGVVLSASYEARANGVRSAMPVSRAAQLCPEAVWIAPDFEKYQRVSEEVRRFLAERFERVSPQSIDEAAMVGELPDPESAEAFARRVKAEIETALRLPCSVGVAGSRLVAKIATDEAKPGGVCVVPPDRTAEFLAPLSVRAIPGVGPKTEELLAGVGVVRIGELRSLPPLVRRKLGRFGEVLYHLARGELPAESDEPEPSARSRSTDHTFDRDTEDVGELEGWIDRLARELADSLARERMRYRTATVAVRWQDFQRVQRSRTFPTAQDGVGPLSEAVDRLFHGVWSEVRAGRARRVRTLSVGVEKLSEAVDGQARLDQYGARPSPTDK